MASPEGFYPAGAYTIYLDLSVVLAAVVVAAGAAAIAAYWTWGRDGARRPAAA